MNITQELTSFDWWMAGLKSRKAAKVLTPMSPLGTHNKVDKRIRDLVHFKIKEKSDLHLVASFEVQENLPSFEGHFPGDPILPAVSIIDISLFLLENVRPNISYNKIEMKRSKFMSFVHPNRVVKIDAVSDNGRDWKMFWSDEQTQERLAQVQLVLPES